MGKFVALITTIVVEKTLLCIELCKTRDEHRSLSTTHVIWPPRAIQLWDSCLSELESGVTNQQGSRNRLLALGATFDTIHLQAASRTPSRWSDSSIGSSWNRFTWVSPIYNRLSRYWSSSLKIRRQLVCDELCTYVAIVGFAQSSSLLMIFVDTDLAHVNGCCPQFFSFCIVT